MTARKSTPINQAAGEQIAAPRAAKVATYVAGSHAARVRSEHDERRTELLARDEILAGEIDRREAERHDINEALQIMSEPISSAVGNVVPLAAE